MEKSRARRPVSYLLDATAPLTGRRAALVVGAALLLVIAVGGLDYATGPQLSVELLYLPPVAVATLLTSRSAGLWLTFASAVCWLLADVALQPSRVDAGVAIWNLVIRSSMFCLVVVLLSALKVARSEAEASSRRSREFLAMAAHQLRTPIAGVRASAEAFMLRGASGVDDALLGHVASEAARAGSLIASMLRMARLDDGWHPPAEVLDVCQLAKAEVDRWRARCPGLRVGLTAPSGPVHICASRDALADALANLLENATRHAATEVGVTITRTRSVVEVTVVDDGPGLPLGAEDRAFERFVSLDSAGGAGLGLAIARSVAESVGGTLTWQAGRFVMHFPPALRRRSPTRAEDC